MGGNQSGYDRSEGVEKKFGKPFRSSTTGGWLVIETVLLGDESCAYWAVSIFQYEYYARCMIMYASLGLPHSKLVSHHPTESSAHLS